ncbi:discoidin domain-containing protein [Dactylosporangium sucinum]|uniref:Glycosyl hydrolase n=1 Tax=Dactylosporangium sucinum TaxID=1424081 RepID=A0A917T0F2_9ACTN|nr:discoidin domain-containing protein [Dactylosporangium sucinum]GGM05299.1 glycosyl hydrolase [Dactylosporangium sucinum]
MRRRIAAIVATTLVASSLTAVDLARTAAPALAAEVLQEVTLAKGTAAMGEPMSLAVLPDRTVLHTSRDGRIFSTDAAGNTRVAGTIPVYTHDEEGLQGIAADPNFAGNRWIYLYYAPPLSTPAGDAPSTGTDADFARWQGYNQLSRFTVRADGTVDLASEKRMLQVTTDRGMCCHVGGDLDFDAQGNLYLTTGDDTQPWSSNGYTPIDERPGWSWDFDAQRSAGNTNDLRGKLLRITPQADGTYTVPAGNLFPPGTARTRPEIYAMGFRNPFRMSVDKATGVVYIGNYAADSDTNDPNRGEGGHQEFERITGPGNHGWPYCQGYNAPYNDYDFATGTSGPKFDCAAPVNDSPHNTGLTNLPAAKPAWLAYDNQPGSPLGNTGGGPMAGPVYRFNPSLNSATKLPQSFDGKFFAGEFSLDWIKTVQVNADGSPGAVESFPWTHKHIMDLAIGPEGALYVLDYGAGWFNGDENSALYRIEGVPGGNRAPTAVVTANRTSGQPPLTVAFSSAGSTDPEGGALTYAWNFGDGGTSTAANPSHTYSANGSYTARLTVTDPAGNTGSASTTITVGNTTPVVTITGPANGSLFDFGDAVPFQVSVTDPEDGTIDCSRVAVNFVLGHDQHGHPITSTTGCTGVLQTSASSEHNPSDNIFGVVDAAYTDRGGLTAHAQIVLQPRHRQAEHFGSSSGNLTIYNTTTAEGSYVGAIDNGDWLAFTTYNLAGTTGVTARVASATAGGTLEFRSDSPTGPLAGSVAVPGTGGWENWTTVSTTLSPQAGTRPLYLTFKGGTGALFNVDAFTFTSSADLARGRPVTVSSTDDPARPGGLAVDGNGATRWSSAYSDPQWIAVDLGGTYTLSRVRLSWEVAYGRAYQIQTSLDGSTWTTVYSTTSGDGGVDDVPVSGSGRFVRVHGTQRATQWGYSLWELNVYGTASLLSQGRPVTTSSVEPGNLLVGANAVDGNGATRWGSAYSDPQWISVDLGSTRTINRVKLKWEAAYGRAYQIQTSADGSTWTTVYSTTTGDGGVDDVTVSGSGRYVRVNGTQRATQWGYSLWELEIYGA